MEQAMFVSYLLLPTTHSKGEFSNYMPVSMSSLVQGIWLELNNIMFPTFGREGVPAQKV